MKKNNGITLVSLVITIVIMLILAGVSISFVVGQNGLFTKSKQATETYKVSSDIEKIKNAWNEYVTDSTERDYTEELTLDAFNTYVTENNVLNVVKSEEEKLCVKVNDNYYEVKKVDNGIEVTKVSKPEDGEVTEPEIGKLYVYKNGEGTENWEENTSVNYSPNAQHQVLDRNVNNKIKFMCGGTDTTVRAAVIRTNNTYDFTNYTSLHIKYNIIGTNQVVDASYKYLYLGVNTRPMNGWNDSDFYNMETRKMDNCSVIGEKEMTIDISANKGENYIFLQGCSLDCEISEVWLQE